ncbi:MAG: hypothetical protein R6V54_13030 [Desulfobacteraceae bacterium]
MPSFVVPGQPAGLMFLFLHHAISELTEEAFEDLLSKYLNDAKRQNRVKKPGIPLTSCECPEWQFLTFHPLCFCFNRVSSVMEYLENVHPMKAIPREP